MNFDELSKILVKTAEKVKDEEGFFAGILLRKAELLSEEFPYDSTVVGMRNFIKNKSKSSHLISRKELKTAYQSLYSNNNKFASAFAEELDIDTSNNISKTSLAGKEPEKILSIYSSTDSDLVNNLTSIFDSSKQYKNYKSKFATQAQANVSLELSSLGFKPEKVEVLTGNEQLIICRAAWDSPKGEVSAVIPVKIVDEVVSLPSTFVSTAGITVLTSDSLKNHLNDTMGKVIKVDADKLLLGLTKYASEPAISDVELAWMRYKTASADTDKIELNHLGLVYSDVKFEEQKIAQAYEVEQPEEVKSLAKQLYSAASLAGMLHGKECVDSSRNYIVKSLKNMGVSAQVSVSNVDQDSIVFSVNANGTHGFNVPVSVVNKVAEFPSVAVAEDKIVDFSKEGIAEILSNKASDQKSMLYASAMYDLQPREILIRLASALEDKNFLKAEDALSVLRSLNDDNAYNFGYKMYCSALKGEENTIGKTSTCSKPVMTKSSIHPVCGHTHLPLNKVYQDKHGNCRPLHRLGKEASEEAATFMNAKIIWGE